MKNLMNLLAIVLIAGLASCSSHKEPARNYRYVGQTPPATSSCGSTAQKPAPVQQVRQEPIPAYAVSSYSGGCGAVPCASAPCAGGCQPSEYTVRTPVKVVYQNTTYRTVYEPRTTQTTSYETRPFNRGEACTSGNCGATQVVVTPQAPMTTVAQPQVQVQVQPQASTQPLVTKTVVTEEVYEK